MQEIYLNITPPIEETIVGIEDLYFYAPPIKVERQEEILTSKPHTSYTCLSTPWEDAATFATNAAKKILAKIKPEQIGLVISYDATYLSRLSIIFHDALNLAPDCHHVDINDKDFSMNVAIYLAKQWLQNPENSDSKVLILFSQHYIPETKDELIKGNGALALLISGKPNILSIAPEFTYFHQENFSEYTKLLAKKFAQEPFDLTFQFSLYDLWDKKIMLSMHNALLQKSYPGITEEEIHDSFRKMVYPSLHFYKENGDLGAANLYIGLLSLLENAPFPAATTPVALFSLRDKYCHELLHAEVNRNARENVQSYTLKKSFSDKKVIVLDDYFGLFNKNSASNFAVMHDELFQEYYQQQPLLIIDSLDGAQKKYKWSNEL